MTIEAVIWDFGGVITTSPFDAFSKFERSRGLPPDFIRQINATNASMNAWARFERAEIDEADFDTEFLRESHARGHEVRGSDVLPLLSGRLRPEMIAALKVCKRHFKVGCITNNMAQGNGPVMSTGLVDASEVAAVMGQFDAVIESSKAGLRKPDPRIYLMMSELLGVRPHSCIYLDDLGVNCKPAAALGMIAIKVSSESQALGDLGRAIGLDLKIDTE